MSLARLRSIAAMTLITLAMAPLVRANILNFILSREVQVLTVTDVKPEGRKLPIPSREHPIYYEGINAGFKEWTRPMANEQTPDSKKMQAAVVRALAKNGYRSADNAHVGTEIIVMSWGTFYGHTMIGMPPALAFLMGDKWDLRNEELGGFFSSLGAENQVIPRLSQSKVREIANGDLYIVLLRAYSVPSANQGRIVELWETRIACPSNGLALDDTLPTMVKLATPNIGLDTAKPIVTYAGDNLHEHIETGEIRVLDDAEVEKAHVTPLSELIDSGNPAPSKAK